MEDNLVELAKEKGFNDNMTGLKELFYMVEIQKWLREVHNIDISIIVNYNQKNQVKSYRCGIIYIDSKATDYKLIDSFFIRPSVSSYDFVEFSSYEEALEEGINSALKVI
jgi:hypothetical protein